MYARVNIIFGQRDKVVDGLAHLEESDRGAVEATAGNLGLTTFVDREAGVIVAVSYWDEPAHSSEAVLTRAREGGAAATGGDLVVAVAHRVDHRCRRRSHRHSSPTAAGRGGGAGRDQVPPDRDLHPGGHLRPGG